ncbi:MAG: hypothetical protein WCC55_07455, partial [Nitrosotalea sp.]
MNPTVNKLQILSLVAILGVVMTASFATTNVFADSGQTNGTAATSSVNATLDNVTLPISTTLQNSTSLLIN